MTQVSQPLVLNVFFYTEHHLKDFRNAKRISELIEFEPFAIFTGGIFFSLHFSFLVFSLF